MCTGMYLKRWIPTSFFLSFKYSLWWSIWDVSDGLFRKFFACGAKYELMKIKLIRSLFISLSLELVVLKLKYYSSTIATIPQPNPAHYVHLLLNQLSVGSICQVVRCFRSVLNNDNILSPHPPIPTSST